MYRNILVPVDLSDRPEPAVRSAADLAGAEGATVHLLHVIETIRGVPYEELEPFYESLRKRAERALDGWAELLAARPISVQREIVFGHRTREIVKRADDAGCDLIVICSRRAGPDRPAGGLGTLSHRVALLAPCAVLLVR